MVGEKLGEEKKYLDLGGGKRSAGEEGKQKEFSDFYSCWIVRLGFAASSVNAKGYGHVVAE
jgi:hypothetical protein